MDEQNTAREGADEAVTLSSKIEQVSLFSDYGAHHSQLVPMAERNEIAPRPEANNGSQSDIQGSSIVDSTSADQCTQKEEVFKCESCQKSFKEESVFKVHVQRKRCTSCKKNYGCLKRLKLHQQSNFCVRNHNKTEIVQGVRRRQRSQSSTSENLLSKEETPKLSGTGARKEFSFKCCKCQRKFGSLASLRVHFSHSLKCNSASAGKFKCMSCNMRLYNENKFAEHQTKQFCKKCKSAFECRGQMRKHKISCVGFQVFPRKEIKSEPIKTSKIKWIKCKFCSNIYRSAHCHLERKFYKLCRVCQREFKCRGLCQAHELTCSKIPENEENHAAEVQEQDDGQKATPQQQEPPLKLRKCVHCELLCASEDTFQNHTRPTKCPRCELVQPCSELMAQHLNLCRFSTVPEPIFKCPMCGQSFAKVDLLGSHVLSCSSAGSSRCESDFFPCRECDKVFYKRSKLRSHEERRHSNQKLKNDIMQLVDENRKLKEMFSKTLVARHVVKKEVETITIDDSDDEQVAANLVRVKKEVCFE